ncbi:MAG: DUF4249 family protein [Bacteroidales bacterium]|nr:DUF4249 family protein [Bacteroidales bacterium]
MKSFRLFVAAVLGCAFLTSCLEEYDLDIERYSDYIVIDALITDCDTVHFVYISPLIARNEDSESYNSSTYYQEELTLNARKTFGEINVRVCDDNTGEEFVFFPIDSIVAAYNLSASKIKAYRDSVVNQAGTYEIGSVEQEKIDSMWYVRYKKFDRFLQHNPSVDAEMQYNLSYSDWTHMGCSSIGPYYTYCYDGCDFKCGHTYTITVEADGRTFTSTQTIQPVPKVDAVKFFTHDSPEGPLLSPSLYFNDVQPDRTNYYVFTNLYQYHRITASSYFYVFLAPFSDENQSSEISGLHMSLGMGAVKDQKKDGFGKGDYYYYELYSISKENYEYYKSMENQLTSDGGVYRPNPSTPLTNFSGENVQGQFVAASKTIMCGRITPWDIEGE